MKQCLLFHKWNKWEEFHEPSTVTYVGLIYPKDMRGKTFNTVLHYQRRICERCGKVDEETIKQ